MTLDAGPRENGHRPAVDPLFRSAAEAFGSAAVGIVLSGTRDDGTAGLAAIKARGGTTLVQDPGDALYPGMPESALAHVTVDAVLPARAIGPAIVSLAREGRLRPGTPINEPPMRDHTSPESTPFVCPECGGRIHEEQRDGVTMFACHVGHVYGPESLSAEQAGATERALWTAVRALEDRAAMLRRMAEQFNRRGGPRTAAKLAIQARGAKAAAEAVRESIVRFGATLRRSPDAGAPGKEGAA
jgi:two-component system chemotaxis response regulator CheB